MTTLLSCSKMRRGTDRFQGFLVLLVLMSVSIAAEGPSATTATTGMTEAATTVTSGTSTAVAAISAASSGTTNKTQTESTSTGNWTYTTTDEGSRNPWRLRCHSFHCFGTQCYQNQSTFTMMMSEMNGTRMPPNATMMPPTSSSMMSSANTSMPPPPPSMYSMSCFNESFCELFRDNATHYVARCTNQCALGVNSCKVNGTTKDMCTVECCNTSMCLRLNSTAYGDMLPTTAPTTTTTTTTTTTPFPGNGKHCRKFACDGADCFKGKEVKEECRTGYEYCELKKTFTGTSVSFTAGCSKNCRFATPSCSGATTGECYQECCNATAAACCMKLDGTVSLNGATQLNRGSLVKLLTCAAIVILSSRFSFLQKI